MKIVIILLSILATGLLIFDIWLSYVSTFTFIPLFALLLISAYKLMKLTGEKTKDKFWLAITTIVYIAMTTLELLSGFEIRSSSCGFFMIILFIAFKVYELSSDKEDE